MATNIQDIKTIVVVMMENRSFDHMLGYLSLPDYGRTDVDGLKQLPGSTPGNPIWSPDFVIPGPYAPFRMPDPKSPLPHKMDPPHERPNIRTQLGPVSATGVYPMNGFVQSYNGKINVQGADHPVVMGYFTGEDLPTTHFFAENFMICDRWFSSLPAGTQPNRLMAVGGESRIDINVAHGLPNQRLAYQWLTDHGVKWRVYAEGIPFFILMPGQWPQISPHFRSFNNFAHDVVNETDADFPEVIFIEPRYTNAPHLETPHDDHAPSAVDGGQRFLMEVYAALTSNPGRWGNSLMIVTYDEHGGFFDHVSPLRISTQSPDNNYPPFESLGVRVPAYLISPFVSPRTVFHEQMDHTAILKFLGERFNGGSYSPAVDQRIADGLSSVSAALGLTTPRAEVPRPAATTEGFTAQDVPFDAISQAFAGAFDQLKRQHPKDIAERFPKLFTHF